MQARQDGAVSVRGEAPEVQEVESWDGHIHSCTDMDFDWLAVSI